MSARQGTLLPRVIDPMKLIRWEPTENGGYWQVGGFGGRRSGEVGRCVGIIALKHAGGYEVALEFEDGKVETFVPLSLFPAVSAAA